MSIKPRYLNAKSHRQSLLLDSSTLAALDYIAPGNLSEAVRLCVQFALDRGVQSLARNLHTDKQREQLRVNAAQGKAPVIVPLQIPPTPAHAAAMAAPYVDAQVHKPCTLADLEALDEEP